MKGHLYKRSSTSWTIVVDVGRDPETNGRKQISRAVKGTKREADSALREMLAALDNGTYVKPNRFTLGEWLVQWFEGYAKMQTSPRTQTAYWSVISQHLIPALGAIPLAQLQPHHVERFYARELAEGGKKRRKALSATSVRFYHRILRQALEHGVKTGQVARNVALLVDPPRSTRPKITVLSPDEIPQFLDVASRTDLYVFYCLLLYTGLRLGEALALRWRRVDLLGAELQVTETIYRDKGRDVVKEPKTAHGRRAVDLPPSLAVLLREHKARQQALRLELGHPLTEDGFVFAKVDGSPLNARTVSSSFHSLVRKEGLPRIRLHDLRHTHATLMLQANVHPKVVSERLGHANISITLDVYSHVLPGMQKAAAEAFDRILDGAEAQHTCSIVSKMLANPTDPPGTDDHQLSYSNRASSPSKLIQS